MSYKSSFNPVWLDGSLHPEFQPWLKESTKNSNAGYCDFCKKPFLLSNMGIRAVKSHMTGKYHISRCKVVNSSLKVSNWIITKKTVEKVRNFVFFITRTDG